MANGRKSRRVTAEIWLVRYLEDVCFFFFLKFFFFFLMNLYLKMIQQLFHFIDVIMLESLVFVVQSLW